MLRRYLLRGLASALLAGALTTASLALLHASRSSIALEFTGELPPAIRGAYPPERDPGGLTFVWTGQQVRLELPGLDRRIPWEARVRLRGARPDPATLPGVRLTTEGAPPVALQTRNEFDELRLTLPVAPGRGAALTLEVSNTFRPSQDDPRELGVQVDWIRIEPDGMAVPPGTALSAAFLTAAIFGIGFGLVGLTAMAATAGAAALGLAGAVAATRGLALYTGYPDVLLWLSFGVSAGTVLGASAARRWNGQPLRRTALFVAAFSGGAAFVKLAILLHPSMPPGDTIFHAHRFEWVLGGRYYFTSVAPGQYEFPYPIGLYLVGLPFAGLASGTAGHADLLRVIGTVADAAAGVLLYPAVARLWRQRLAGAMAVGFYHLLPLNFRVLATGNWTNSFAQSVALVALAALALLPFRRAPRRSAGLAAALLAAAFLSHTSTFAIMAAAGFGTGLLFRFSDDPDSRPAGWPVLMATLAAVLLSVLLYYGHFGETYRTQLGRIAGEVGASAATPSGRSAGDRLLLVFYSLEAYFGWPVMLLALVGGAVRFRAATTRLDLTLLGLGLSCLAFLVLGVLTPIDMRHYLAALPILAALGGSGATALWLRGGAYRPGALALMAWAIWAAVQGAFGWLPGSA